MQQAEAVEGLKVFDYRLGVESDKLYQNEDAYEATSGHNCTHVSDKREDCILQVLPRLSRLLQSQCKMSFMKT